MFPNGICLTFDGQSILFAETFAYRISRYWFDGPKAGTVEPVIPNLPGLPDNINRASDGNFWCAIAGLRGPAMDIALRMPDFRRRMIYRVAPDEWLFAQMNTGFVFKFNLQGQVLDVLWDREGVRHSVIRRCVSIAVTFILVASRTIGLDNFRFPAPTRIGPDRTPTGATNNARSRITRDRSVSRQRSGGYNGAAAGRRI